MKQWSLVCKTLNKYDLQMSFCVVCRFVGHFTLYTARRKPIVMISSLNETVFGQNVPATKILIIRNTLPRLKISYIFMSFLTYILLKFFHF